MIELKNTPPYYRFGEGGNGTAYKEYVALVSQNGTDEPTAVILSNTLGEVTWARMFTGGYSATFTEGGLTYAKTTIEVNQMIGAYIAQGTWISETEIQIIIFLPLGGPSDNVLAGTGVKIRVYK